MLTCPHCLHTFEPSDSTRSCCGASNQPVILSPPPCLRVFANSGGGLVVTSTEKPSFPQPPQQSVQVTFSQPSPSVQLSFVLPPPTQAPWFPAVVTPTVRPHDIDIIRITNTQRALRASGWYYEGLSWQESAAILERCTPGTFLVRDSSDPRFLFSLSVQTARGPTSVRLHYINGQFRLDAEEQLARYIPTFSCVLTLVEHYVKLGKRRQTQDSISGTTAGCSSDKEQHVWVDLRGHMYSPILLTAPKRRKIPSLQHLARLAINERLQQQRRYEDVPALNLPPSIQDFLREYPYAQ